MNVCVVMTAAGSSTRYARSARALGIDHVRSKLDEDLGGRPLLHRTLELFANRSEVSSIVVAGPADPEQMDQFRLRHADKLSMLGAALCPGGKDFRWQTVAAALNLVPASATHVAVHDAARACTPDDLLQRVFNAASTSASRGFAGVVPALPVSDSLKRVDEITADSAPHDPLAAILGVEKSATATVRTIRETVPREALVAVQTPQVFLRETLVRAYSQPDLSSTDDAQLVERLGQRVEVVDGDARNIKVTYAADLAIARAILGFKPPQGRETHKRF